jgi:hypothetical protein
MVMPNAVEMAGNTRHLEFSPAITLLQKNTALYRTVIDATVNDPA